MSKLIELNKRDSSSKGRLKKKDKGRWKNKDRNRLNSKDSRRLLGKLPLRKPNKKRRLESKLSKKGKLKSKD